jgi:hypothetical protein
MRHLPAERTATSAAGPATASITIQPEPSADERDAVVAAVLALAVAQAAPQAAPVETPSRWAQAGRWEAIRRRADVARGWGNQQELWSLRAQR